jgi:arylsulfatase
LFQSEFRHFVSVQQEVAMLAQTAIEFAPMQKGASVNLDAVKAKTEGRQYRPSFKRGEGNRCVG